MRVTPERSSTTVPDSSPPTRAPWKSSDRRPANETTWMPLSSFLEMDRPAFGSAFPVNRTARASAWVSAMGSDGETSGSGGVVGAWAAAGAGAGAGAGACAGADGMGVAPAGERRAYDGELVATGAEASGAGAGWRASAVADSEKVVSVIVWLCRSHVPDA